MKNKFKAFGLGLIETIVAAGGIALAVWDFVMIPKLTGFVAVVIFIAAVLSLTIGIIAILRIGYGRLASYKLKEVNEKLHEFIEKNTKEVEADGEQE